MPGQVSRWVLGAAVAAGAVGVGLGAAGVVSALRTALVLLFLAVAPTVAIAGLLPALDGFARLIIAGTANIAVLSLTAMIMLAEGVWSPRLGLLAVAAITAVCLLAQLPPVRRAAKSATQAALAPVAGRRPEPADPRP